MLTVKNFLDAGFKIHTDTMSSADVFLQKRIYSVDPHGDTLYFINVYHYCHAGRESWELDMAFDRDSTTIPYCWVKYMIGPTATVSDIERLAKDSFISNDGVPYGD